MRKLLFWFLIFFVVGCANKTVNKTNSLQLQKQHAQKAWNELDKE
jgi:hypothetical protein